MAIREGERSNRDRRNENWEQFDPNAPPVYTDHCPWCNETQEIILSRRRTSRRRAWICTACWGTA